MNAILPFSSAEKVILTNEKKLWRYLFLSTSISVGREARLGLRFSGLRRAHISMPNQP
jgi:hypothetical protein